MKHTNKTSKYKNPGHPVQFECQTTFLKDKCSPCNLWAIPLLKNYLLLIRNSDQTEHPAFHLAILFYVPWSPSDTNLRDIVKSFELAKSSGLHWKLSEEWRVAGFLLIWRWMPRKSFVSYQSVQIRGQQSHASILFCKVFSHRKRDNLGNLSLISITPIIL